MTLKDIVTNSQFFTDETLTSSQYLSVANKAIALINVECRTLFPRFESDTTSYTYMPKDWLFSLISPYVSYGIKMNDSSLTEAEMYLNEFYKALENFKDNLGTLISNFDGTDPNSGISSDMVQDTGFGGVYEISTENAINVGFFGRNGNGGSW